MTTAEDVARETARLVNDVDELSAAIELMVAESRRLRDINIELLAACKAVSAWACSSGDVVEALDKVDRAIITAEAK